MATGKEFFADNQKPYVHSIPAISGSATTSAAKRQSPAVEKGVTQAYVEDNESPQFLPGKEPLAVPAEEKDYQEKSPAGKGHQPSVSFSETLHEAKEESTPRTIATPELHSETVAGEESLPVEAKGTRTPAVDNKFHLTADDNGSSFTSAEESSYTATERDSHVLIKRQENLKKEYPHQSLMQRQGKRQKI